MHDEYGSPLYTEMTDESVIYYYSHNGSLIVGTYCRRTTTTTYAVQSLPPSMA